MKGKIFALLFALPFFGVGVFMTWSIGNNLLDASQMSGWEPVQATLQRAGVESHRGEDSDTYQAFASYTYLYGGRQYTATRVAIAGGADNIGNFQSSLGNRLARSMSRGESITAYVDPDEPSSAVIDRSVRWGLIGFKSIFLFVFGGVGLGLIIFILRAPQDKDPAAIKYVGKPWLVNDDWQSADIKSSSKATMYFAWVFAVIWNLISAPLPFVVYEEVTSKNNLPALLGLLFPVIGVFLLIWALRRTLEWNRFGPAPVTLDPFPGSIGGHVGGTIDLNLPYDSTHRFSLTLTSLRSYISGSGKNRSRKEDPRWQDTQVAHLASASRGSRLSFRFDVPDDLAEADADRSDDTCNIWRLNLKANLPGIDIDRDYDIPVYATGQESVHLSNFSIDRARTEQRSIDQVEIEKLFILEQGVNGKTMFFPMGRNLMGGLGALLFGSIFSGIGWFLITKEDHYFMGGVFGLVGGIILLSAFYLVLNSLEVVKEGSELRTIRRLFGIPIKTRQMRVADFARFSKRATSKTQSGSKHVVKYAVSAVDRNHNRMVVAEGFTGVSQADAAAEFIGREFGLAVRPDLRASVAPAAEQYNILTAD
ncbi:MAG: DUF3592 domain-containing protein [Woeseiaceae bacterium]